MPQKYEDLGLTILYPDNWQTEEDIDAQTVTLESPEGAFLTVTRLEQTDLESPIEQAKAAMEHEYEEIEQEPLRKQIADRQLTGLTQRFVYLDLIITSHLISFHGNNCTYLIQIQAEDRDMMRLDRVFDAMLLSICQSLAS